MFVPLCALSSVPRPASLHEEAPFPSGPLCPFLEVPPPLCPFLLSFDPPFFRPKALSRPRLNPSPPIPLRHWRPVAAGARAGTSATPRSATPWRSEPLSERGVTSPCTTAAARSSSRSSCTHSRAGGTAHRPRPADLQTGCPARGVRGPVMDVERGAEQLLAKEPLACGGELRHTLLSDCSQQRSLSAPKLSQQYLH